METAIPIIVMAPRFVCPFCRRGHSKRKAAAAHIAHCWRNPALRGCRSCALYRPAEKCGHGSERHDYTPEPHGCVEGIALSDDGAPNTNCATWEAIF